MINIKQKYCLDLTNWLVPTKRCFCDKNPCDEHPPVIPSPEDVLNMLTVKDFIDFDSISFFDISDDLYVPNSVEVDGWVYPVINRKSNSSSTYIGAYKK